MVAYTDSLGFYKNSVGFTANYTDRLSVMEIELDFAKIAAARTAAGAAALAATDTLVIGVLPKGSFVLSGVATLEKAEGAAGNIDVGIGGGVVDFWVDGFDLNAAVGTSGGFADALGTYCAVNTNILCITFCFPSPMNTRSSLYVSASCVHWHAFRLERTTHQRRGLPSSPFSKSPQQVWLSCWRWNAAFGNPNNEDKRRVEKVLRLLFRRLLEDLRE